MQCSPSGLVDVTFTWLSNYPATSRVLYDTVSKTTLGSAPNYNYASTLISNNLVTGHSVTIAGLNPATVYYFRPVSVYNFSEVVGPEKMMTETLACTPGQTTPPIVLGEAGAPILTITHQALSPFVNPGSKGVEYKIVVTNTGDLTSYETVLTNVLPDDLTYSDDGSQTKSWLLGDLEPGASRTISVKVDVSLEAEPQDYISLASTRSKNHPEVSAPADVEVRLIKVLADTGFSLGQFIFLLALIGLAVGSRQQLKKYLAASRA